MATQPPPTILRSGRQLPVTPQSQPIESNVSNLGEQATNARTDGAGLVPASSGAEPNPTTNTNPTTTAAIPGVEPPKDQTEVETMLFTYKKETTKLTKCKHHAEFLEEASKTRVIPKGLQLKFKLNAVEQTRGLEARITGILLAAELEIVEELREHYKELSENITQKLQQIEQTLSPLANDNRLVKDTFDASKSENQILEQKLKTRREKKKANDTPSTDKRIRDVEEGKSQGNATRDNSNGQPRGTRRNYANRQEREPRTNYRQRDPQHTSQWSRQTQNQPDPRERQYTQSQNNQPRNYHTVYPNWMAQNNRQQPNQLERIERELGDIVNNLRNFIQIASRSFPPQNYQYMRQPF